MVSRRQFLGYSALQTAAALGLSSVSLKTLSANPARLAQATTPLSNLGRVPVVLIGTGYGNAVTALRLAEKGLNVVMLEMGQLWNEQGSDGKVFSPTMNKNWDWAKARWNNKVDGRSMWNRTATAAPVREYVGVSTSYNIDRYAGVLDLIEYDNNHTMKVYAGRGVGGGSLVNGAMAVTPSRKSFEEVFPQVNADEMYKKDGYFDRANKNLKVNHVDPAWFEDKNTKCYQFARVSRDSAEATPAYNGKTMFVPTTYDLNYLKKEQAGTVPRSALDQEVIFGNNAGKNSLDKTYLAQAVGTGRVSIYTLQQVVDIKELSDSDGGGYELTVCSLNKNLNPSAYTYLPLKCDALFLGAGSCGTSELLVRAQHKGTLPKLASNSAIGHGWGNNGNIMGARFNWKMTGDLQSTMPLMGINDWDNRNNPVFCEITPLPVGLDHMVSMYLAITKTPSRSSFTYDTATNKVNLAWNLDKNSYSLQSAMQFLDKINASQRTGYCYDLFGTGRAFADNFTYHPLGGCVLGKATDDYGRIKEYQRLYVTDGSLIPGVLGVNPFVTITALAERNIERIIAEDFKK